MKNKISLFLNNLLKKYILFLKNLKKVKKVEIKYFIKK